jgi:hypothetical protein
MSKSNFIDIFPSQKKEIEGYWKKSNLGKKINAIDANKLLELLEKR